MKPYHAVFRLLAVSVSGAAIITLLLTQALFGQEEKVKRYFLDNGMEIILKENHASPMITSLVFVKSGSKYESVYNNGVTHFLEHLLFNGTATNTQEQLSRGIERLGGYMNAFTRKEFTAYLVLMPKDYINYGMATQADMLFNSIFPEEKFPKERKIVLEEMKKDNDAEGTVAENYFAEKSLAGTPYARPVIGYESIIANIPREAVIDYWKRFYGPNNMTALIIGDFETAQMEVMVQSIFGRFPKADLPPAPVITVPPISGKQVFRTAAKTKSSYINYSIEAPRYTDSAYFAMALLQDYLSDEENSPLIKALTSGGEMLATSVSAYIDTKEEFSRFVIEIVTEKPERADSIIALTDAVLESLGENPPSEELLNGYKVSRRCEEIYMSEKLHYYGFTVAPLMAITGWDFFRQFQNRIDSVTAAEIAAACQKYFSPINYVATVVTPASSDTEAVYQAAGPTDEELLAHYQSNPPQIHDLNLGKKFKMPEVQAFSQEEKRYARYARQIFDNGLTVIVKSNPDSRVFALNVIGKNRSATEPEGKEGITDFVNRLIEKGTTSRNAEQLSQELATIGAKVTLYDNPWIPYDDRYTTRQFSFMKFETIDEFTVKGIELFSDMIAHPAFDSAEVEKVRSEIMGLLGRNSGSTYKIARDKFYATLFSGTAYGRSIEGSPMSIGSITIDDLKAHHRRIYSPENMIITVGTNDDPQKVMSLLKISFERIPKSGFTPIEATRPANPSGIKTAHHKMEKEQIYIYLGNLLPSAKSPDAAALDVTASVLSKRLQKVLREEQGLAYSVGAGVTLDRNFGWFICSIGTGVANFARARDGIIAEIEKLKTEMPSKEEVEEAINSIWGSNLTANLSRINQAYYMGVNEYLGLGYDHDDVYIDEIRKIDRGLVLRTARRYFDTKNYVMATAGNLDI
ncbi:MAG: insulinase family protein [bacterium]|jgi:predicted Zn-dependent peptidase